MYIRALYVSVNLLMMSDSFLMVVYIFIGRLIIFRDLIAVFGIMLGRRTCTVFRFRMSVMDFFSVFVHFIIYGAVHLVFSICIAIRSRK